MAIAAGNKMDVVLAFDDMECGVHRFDVQAAMRV